MIESRYKIEYVLPVTEEPTSNKAKLISFILLAPVALLIAGAIAYGLGYKALPKEALEIFATLKQDVSAEKEQAEAENGITEIKDDIAATPEVTVISETGTTYAPDMNIPAPAEDEADLPEDVVLLDTQAIAPSTSSIKVVPTQDEAISVPIENTKAIPESISNDTSVAIINPAVEKIEEMMLKDTQQKQADENQQSLVEDSLDNNAVEQPEEIQSVMENEQALDTQEVIQKSDTETLAELIEYSLKNISKNDQEYVAALNNSVETRSSDSTEKIVPLNLENSVKSEKAAEAPKQSTQTITSYNNSVSFKSSPSPVDAIIAAMQGIQAKPTEQPGNSNAGLQNELNQLIKDDTTKAGVLFSKALDQEYKDRSNETRSIIVKKGETLWNIAIRAYGNGNDYTKILKSNPQLSETTLKQLTEGQILRVPL